MQRHWRRRMCDTPPSVTRLVPAGWQGPRPSGGVGGTRRGVKCIHAHVAWWLVGGDDPIGDWAAVRIGLTRP